MQGTCFFLFLQIMFEDYQFEGVSIAIQPILALNALGQLFLNLKFLIWIVKQFLEFLFLAPCLFKHFFVERIFDKLI